MLSDRGELPQGVSGLWLPRSLNWRVFAIPESLLTEFFGMTAILHEYSLAQHLDGAHPHFPAIGGPRQERCWKRRGRSDQQQRLVNTSAQRTNSVD